METTLIVAAWVDMNTSNSCGCVTELFQKIIQLEKKFLLS
jgi:hypothetical protein